MWDIDKGLHGQRMWFQDGFEAQSLSLSLSHMVIHFCSFSFLNKTLHCLNFSLVKENICHVSFFWCVCCVAAPPQKNNNCATYSVFTVSKNIPVVSGQRRK